MIILSYYNKMICFIICFVIIFLIITKLLLKIFKKKCNDEINIIKNEINKQADIIINNFFKDKIINNKNITLDECILLFENSEYDNLEEFSESKMRNAESYRNIYEKYYKKAKITN